MDISQASEVYHRLHNTCNSHKKYPHYNATDHA
jgi:hypothetical protein